MVHAEKTAAELDRDSVTEVTEPNNPKSESDNLSAADLGLEDTEKITSSTSEADALG